MLLPHGPWLYFPDGKRERGRERQRARAATASSGGTTASRTRRTSGTCSSSPTPTSCSASFLDRLEKTGLWDKALVLVTADHGISFHGGDNRRAPTDTNLAELAFTPLFIKFPGESEGKVVEQHVTIADILPTVADGLGIKVPWSIEGRSALGDDFEE